MAERDYALSWPLPERTSFVAGTGIEIIRPGRPAAPPAHALFDFDGTLSLVREGWMDIMVPMMVGILAPFARAGETPASLEGLVRDFVERLTGKQTIYQMVRLAEEVSARGGQAREPLEYKEMYHERLMARIARRRSGLADGTIAPEAFLVPGSLDMLRLLRDRGCAVYIASGTDERYVLEEAALLGLDLFAPGKIYGAQADVAAFSKEMVIRRILAENGVEGARLAAFGDGYVEIADCKAAGGFAVAVASDESGRSGKADPWKRDRLAGAGADIVVPDYRDSGTIAAYLWGEELPEGAA